MAFLPGIPVKPCRKQPDPPSEATHNDDIRPMFDVHDVDDVQRPMYDDSQPMSDVHSTGDDKGDRCGSAQVPGSPDALKNLENSA